MGKYDIPTLTRNFLPWFWQNAPNLSLADVLQSSLDQVNDDYLAVEIDITQRVGYSIQRLSLESGLNDRFDDTLRQIQVINGEVNIGAYIFNEGEAIPATEDEKFIFNEGEAIPASSYQFYVYNQGEPINIATSPFTVTAPLSLSGQEREIRAYIEAVQILSTEYILIFV